MCHEWSRIPDAPRELLDHYNSGWRTKIKQVSSQEGGTLRFPALLSERDGAGIPALMKPAEFEVLPMDV
jgi:hypothetical protein